MKDSKDNTPIDGEWKEKFIEWLMEKPRTPITVVDHVERYIAPKTQTSTPIENGGWISVEDRLPEIGEHEQCTEVIMNSYVKGALLENAVLCGVFYNGKFYVATEWYQGEFVDSDDNTPIEDGRISHWRPLPAQPNSKPQTEKQAEDDVEKAAEDYVRSLGFEYHEWSSLAPAFIAGAKWDREKQQGMKWIKASERLPEANGYYFVKSRYGQMSCYFDTGRIAFSHKWNDEYDNVRWLDESAPKQQGNEAADERFKFNKSCGICGGRLVMIRSKYPGSEDRPVCPTCNTERLEQIHEISSKSYGVAMTEIPSSIAKPKQP